MEKEIQLSRRDFLKALGVTAGFVVAGAIAESVGGEDIPHEQDPEYNFMPVPYPTETIKPSFPVQRTIVEFPVNRSKPVLSPAEIREKKIKKELSSIKKIMIDNPKVFDKKRIEDVGIYYPIYKAVGDKNKIPWYLLFVVHEAETGASAGKRGFSSKSYYKGAMQLDPQWTGSFMESSAKGLKYLAKLPQRHEDDWKNIATGGKLLGRNFRKYKRLGTDKAVLNTLLLYSADDQALKRFKTYQKYEKLLHIKKKNPQRKIMLQRAS